MSYTAPTWQDVDSGNPVPPGAPAIDTTHLQPMSDAVAALDATTLDTGALRRGNNLSDLKSVTTARTNLGLGSAATHASTDFDLSGAATAVLPNQAGNAGKLLSTDGSALTWSPLPFSAMVAVGSASSPVTNVNATRPNAASVLWIHAGGVIPANAVVGDLLCDITTGAIAGVTVSTTTVNIDNNLNIGTTDGTVQYSGGDWTYFTDGTHTFHYCSTSGDSLTIRFTGIAIAVHGVNEANGGIFTYSLDGGTGVTHDTYNASTQFDQTWFTLTGLANTTHTLTLSDTGTKNGSAGGSGGFDFSYAVVTQTTGGSSPGGTAGPRSAKDWRSGLWPYRTTASGPAYTTAAQYQETQRGKQVDVVRAAQYANQWQDLAGNIPTFYGLQILDFLDDYCTGAGPLPILMLPPWPSNISGNWGAAAAGTYDANWNAIGQSIANKRPTTTTYIELAWEANGTWYDWSITGTNAKSAGGKTNYLAGMQRCITQIRAGAGAAASHIKFVQTFSGLDVYGSLDPLNDLYVGDGYIDVIGIDTYDWNGVTTTDTTPGHATDYQRIYDFCSAHGKTMSFSEWGLHHVGAANEGGDNPHFIRALEAWFEAHKGRIEYENYFQDDNLGNVNSGLFSPTVNNNPNSRAAYLATD